MTVSMAMRRVLLATGLFFAARSDIDLAIDGLGEAAPDELRSALRDLFGRRVDLVDPAPSGRFDQATFASFQSAL